MRPVFTSEVLGFDVTFRTELLHAPANSNFNVLAEPEHKKTFDLIAEIGFLLMDSEDSWKFGNVILALSDPYLGHNSTQYVKTDILDYDSHNDILTIRRPELASPRKDIYTHSLREAKIPAREVLFAVANTRSESGVYIVDEEGKLTWSLRRK